MASDYTTLITAGHRDKPKFVETVGLLTGALGQIYDRTVSLTEAFNIDVAVGAQLDIIGLWVGISRRQLVPIADAFFSWDTPGLGWDQANWKGPFEAAEGITILDDETYRAVIKAKIGSNYWDGTGEEIQVIGQEAFDDLDVQCFVLDHLDMTITIYILGAPTAALIEMIKRGIAPPKPAGVKINGYILASTPGAPFFALSVPTTTEVAGLDFGSFGDPV